MRTIKSITLTPKQKQYLLISLIAIAFLAFTGYGVHSVKQLKGNLESQKVQIKNNQAELEKKNLELEKAKKEHDQNNAKNEEQIQKLEQEKQDLEAQLQAKIESKNRLAEAARTALNKATGTSVAYAASLPSGSHEDWMRAAGIAESDFGYVNYIVNRESGWNPNAVNKSSGACGLGQQLPCGKWAGAWNDPIAALVAMQGYAHARYGSWANAYNFWTANHWW